ncbi:PepSY-associated TM helix domain-containing protein [Orrella dioscoreae]|uniref:PepSY-associated TM helix domain-containing protein n=1 Tax=Orrella dioscoreae TaxID=1851544 RepID=UPI00082F095C|nr:PepSY-associated TM helix domain-containing protein [Orrella dioscoreae]
MRALLVRVHRWVGLAIGGFLLVTAVSGIPLAWHHALDAWAAPALWRAPDCGAEGRLDALVLRDIVRDAFPQGHLPAAPLGGEAGRALAVPVWFVSRADAAPVLHEVFVHPCTGAIQGSREWGDIRAGWVNLVPFLYRLHASLLLGGPGEWLLGIVALLWTLDCFVGLVLTWPTRRRVRADRPAALASSWWSRWWPAWRVRWTAGRHKRNVDLHRAGGLWAWALLLAMAWSSVAFNLPAVYEPVMRGLFAHQSDGRRPAGTQGASQVPALSFAQARERGREIMAGLAREEGFAVRSEHWLALDARRGVYRYTVRSSRDLLDRGGATSVFLDAADGSVRGSFVPTGRAAGDTLRHVLTSLHRAAWGGGPVQLALALLGGLLVVLVLTGVFIWQAKRRALRFAGKRN